MTGRELAAALRPLEVWAEGILRFRKIADEAIRMESKLTGLELAQTRLAETQAKVVATQAALEALVEDAATLTARLAEERAAALAATEVEQAALVRAAQREIAKHQVSAEGWAAQTREAESQHAARMTAMATEAAEMQTRLDGLREQAQRMLTAAGQVLR